MIVESNSSMNTAMDCARKYFYKYIKRIDEGQFSESRELGSLIHHYMAAANGKADQKSAVATLKELFPNNHDDIDRMSDLASRVTLIHRNYWDRESGTLSNEMLSFIDVETEWEYPVINDMYVGVRDGCVRHKSYKGDFYYEIKTTGERDINSYIHNLENSSQVDSNLLSLRQEGKEPVGALYDIIRRPMIRQKKSETTEEFWERWIDEYVNEPTKFFIRVIIMRNDAALEIADKEIAAKFQLIHHNREQGIHPRNTSTCMKWGRLCSYFNMCMDPRGEELAQTMKTRDKKLPEISDKWKDAE